VDALDERVDAHADEVAARSGGIDISFNAISHNSVHGTPMAETALEARLPHRRDPGVLRGRRADAAPALGRARPDGIRVVTLRTCSDARGRGDVAAFVASDRVRTLTAATVDISCGALVD
jgi:hypothetical protein